MRRFKFKNILFEVIIADFNVVDSALGESYSFLASGSAPMTRTNLMVVEWDSVELIEDQILQKMRCHQKIRDLLWRLKVVHYCF